VQPWAGTLFRFQTVDFPTPEDVVSDLGAGRRGGRWNPPGIPAVYGSTTEEIALEECKANDRYAGIVNRSPRLRVAVEVRLGRILNLIIGVSHHRGHRGQFFPINIEQNKRTKQTSGDVPIANRK
jgi:RES domain-containing protein